jgi:RND family efflux transporter MFP subunit
MLLPLLVTACGAADPLPTEHSPTQATRPAAPPAPPPVREFVGVVTTSNSKVIAADFQGRITDFKVHAGQRVKAGDIVGKLDESDLKDQLAKAQADERAANDEANALGSQYGGLARKANAERRLVKLGVSAPMAAATATAELGQVGGQVAAAKSKAKAAHVEVERLEKLLGTAEIKAPLDGIVTMIKAHEGEVAQKGTPLARVFDPSDLIIRFAVPKEDRDAIDKGQKVELTLEGEKRTIWATVTNISEAQEPPINFAVVEADIDDSKLAPGEIDVATVGRVRIADARGAKQ